MSKNNNNYRGKRNVKKRNPTNAGLKQIRKEIEGDEHKQITTAIPRDIIYNNKYRYVRRYISSASVNADLTIQHILSAFIVAVTTVLGYSPFFAVRLRKMMLWTPIEVIGTPVSNSLTPLLVETDINSFSDVPTTFTATTGTIEKLAANGLVPKKTHPSGSWHQTNAVSASLVRVLAPKGSILQLELEGILRTSGNVSGYSETLIAAFPGSIYCRSVLANFAPTGSINAI